MPVSWTINDTPLADLGLANPRLSQVSFAADMLELDHVTAAWDDEPIFAYGDLVVLKRNAVIVFVGKVRRLPRFIGAQAESITYQIAGPWDWLERRPYLQEQAVVEDPETSEEPVGKEQGLVVLGQDDGGSTINVNEALESVLDQAIEVGVGIDYADIEDFDYEAPWDEIADVSLADAILRILATAPDAVGWWDYTTVFGGEPVPTLHIERPGSLEVSTLAVVPTGYLEPLHLFGGSGYTEFESISLTARYDLQVSGVHLFFRRINSNNGTNYVSVEEQTAGPGAVSDENALVRTIQLAGSSVSSTVLEQECVTALIPVALANTEELTSGADFDAILEFLSRTEGWVLAPGTSITKIKASAAHSINSSYRRALVPNPTTGVVEEDFPDTSLVRELVEGYITPWMEAGGYNRKGEEQEVAFLLSGTRSVNGESESFENLLVTRAFMATNASTRTYRYQSGTDVVDQEPTPAGLAQSLYNAYSGLKHEGQFTLVQEECTLAVRPGKVVNLTGGRAEWETMRAVVQSVQAELETGRTTVQLGWPKQLTPDSLLSIWRANRLRKTADNGLRRATGLV